MDAHFLSAVLGLTLPKFSMMRLQNYIFADFVQSSMFNVFQQLCAKNFVKKSVFWFLQ